MLKAMESELFRLKYLENLNGRSAAEIAEELGVSLEYSRVIEFVPFRKGAGKSRNSKANPPRPHGGSPTDSEEAAKRVNCKH